MKYDADGGFIRSIAAGFPVEIAEKFVVLHIRSAALQAAVTLGAVRHEQLFDEPFGFFVESVRKINTCLDDKNKKIKKCLLSRYLNITKLKFETKKCSTRIEKMFVKSENRLEQLKKFRKI